MQRIDAHQHFWQFDPVRDSWINEKMSVIKKDFLPADLLPVLMENGVDGTVIVQSDQSEKENDFQLANAGKFDFIKGVVGWVDLQSATVEERLAYYSSFEKMKGFRHVLQDEEDRALMLKPAFMNGIARLDGLGFTYDILIFPDQLTSAAELVAAFPQQKFVLDHIAKPEIRNGNIKDWKAKIESLAVHENLYCKISGMVTEADWRNWRQEDFIPYMDTIVEAFGMNRLMFGSDWPVCLVAASYQQVMEITTNYFSAFSDAEKQRFYGGNASEFYNL